MAAERRDHARGDGDERLKLLGIEQPILVGPSSGGSIALRYALDYPVAVAGLVLLAQRR
jgi:pimeloyl-ACP methyl ester carboxylesterase